MYYYFASDFVDSKSIWMQRRISDIEVPDLFDGSRRHLLTSLVIVLRQ